MQELLFYTGYELRKRIQTNVRAVRTRAKGIHQTMQDFFKGIWQCARAYRRGAGRDLCTGQEYAKDAAVFRGNESSLRAGLCSYKIGGIESWVI
mgnify:CR=1 FL=1